MPVPNTSSLTRAAKALSRVATDRKVLAAIHAAVHDPKSFKAAKSSPVVFLRKAGATVPRGVKVSLQGHPAGGDPPIRPYPPKELCIEVCVDLGGARFCIRFCEDGRK